jgi:hypothetical protein
MFNGPNRLAYLTFYVALDYIFPLLSMPPYYPSLHDPFDGATEKAVSELMERRPSSNGP